jgi:tetratricopeptide (TPR) repeat protein
MPVQIRAILGLGMKRISVILLAAVALAGCQGKNSSSSASVGQISPDMRPQYDAAFQEMLNNPGDLEAKFKYAAIAKKAGDLEGAIGTYEGLLLVQSDLPKVRVELGMLYYQLKSYPVARSHLEAALKSPTLPADLRKPTEELLTKMPKQTRASQV